MPTKLSELTLGAGMTTAVSSTNRSVMTPICRSSDGMNKLLLLHILQNVGDGHGGYNRGDGFR
jgi:hypothetical protein